MYAHDGRGLGHLRRLCRIAKALQGACAVLLITGHRAASWLVPETCEFFHLPSIDNLDRRLSAHWGRNPFWDAGRKEGLRVRQAAIDSIIGSFAPDAIIMDYLAAGKDDEMYTVLDRFPARRYLLLRGVLDDLAAVQRDILNPTGLHLLEKRYDRVLVMADRKIVDVVAEYELSEAVAEKVIYAGYVADQIDESMREQTRVERGIPKAAKWVVCSAGGGKEGEDLVEHCFKITGEFPEVFFDIVVGPRSRSALESTTAQGSGRVRVSKERVDLPRLHGSCDVLVCRGGYNSLMEGAIGRTRIIVVPTADDHEQLTHATRLAAFLPVAVIEDVHLLATRLRDELAAEPRDDTKVPLDFTGADSAARIILGDLLESRR
jgi:predicted glycosyltransferase